MLTTVVTGLALNTVSTAQVETNATRILVSNRSIYDIAVYFDQMTINRSSANPVGAGTVVVHPRHVAKITLSAGTAHYANFIGTVYLYPVSSTGNFANNGTGSTPAVAYVTSLVSGDEDVSIAADAMSYDAQSQQRVITVPIACQTLVTGFHGWAGLEVFQPNDLNTGSLATISGTGNIANQFVSVYLYRCNFCVVTGDATGQNIMTVYVQEWNGLPGLGGAVTANHAIHTFGWATAAVAPYTPDLASNPPRLGFQCAANTVVLGVAIGNANGNGIQLTYDVAIETDMANINSTSFTGLHFPPPIGGGLNGLLYSTISGTVKDGPF